MVNGNNPTSVQQANELTSRAPLIPLIQDDAQGKLWASLHKWGDDSSGKDDIIIFDKEGNLLHYFDADESFVGRSPNDVFNAVDAIRNDLQAQTCKIPSKCIRATTACNEMYQPVCGADGVTYSNSCKADLKCMAYENGQCGQDGGDNGDDGDDNEPSKCPEQKQGQPRGSRMGKAFKAKGFCDCHTKCEANEAVGFSYKGKRNKNVGRCQCWSKIKKSKNSKKWVMAEY